MKTSALLVGASALCFIAIPVSAQESEDESARTLNTITVTSQRVEQNIQDVPISIAAVSGDVLDTRQITDFSQLQFIVPGVNFNAGLNSRASANTIRGIGTSTFFDGIEASVGIVIDGVVIGREGAGISDFSDVERVEVLRGPQGTLFGKNASAGLISITTKGPTEDFEADFGVSYGSFNDLRLNAGVSGPIVEDKLLFRLSGYQNRRDGFIDNVFPDATQTDLNDRNEYGFRGKLEYRPTETLSLLFSADYQNRDTASGAFTTREASAGGPGFGLLGFGPPIVGQQLALFGITPGEENREIAADGEFIVDTEIYGFALEANWDIGDHTLTSLSAYRKWDFFTNNDADLIPLPFLAQNGSAVEQDQFSQEFRLASPTGNRLDYQAGLYLFTQTIDRQGDQAGTVGLDLLGALPPGLILGTSLESEFEELNYAVFGQASYELVPNLRVIGGLRLLYSDLEATQTRGVTEGAVGPFAGQTVTPEPLMDQVDDTAVVWRAGLQYEVNPDLNLFTTVTRGYKSAGIGFDFSTGPATPGGTDLPIVDPEIPLQFEAGFRSTLLDGRLVANITGFYTQVDDFQTQAVEPGDTGTFNFIIVNAGELETYGIEGDFSYLATDALTLSGSFAWTDATFSDFPGGPCIFMQPVGPNECVDADSNGTGDFQDLAGADLPNSPDFVFNGSARYEFPETFSVEPFFQLGLQYRSETVTALDNDPRSIQDAYTLLDAQLGFTTLDGRWSVHAFGRNLTDQKFVEAIFDAPFDNGGLAQFVSYESEQVFGVALRASF